jgi:hypothetical protein
MDRGAVAGSVGSSEVGELMTHDFVDPFMRAEISYRQSRVSADWALPGRPRRRVRKVRLAKREIAPALAGDLPAVAVIRTARARRPRRVLGPWRHRELAEPVVVVPWSVVRAAAEHEHELRL